MTDTIRYIIAGALILLIIVLQPVYMKWLGYDTSQPDLEQTSQAQTINPTTEETKKYIPAIPSQEDFSLPNDALETFITISTPLYTATLSNRSGGSIEDYTLTGENSGKLKYLGGYDKNGFFQSDLPVSIVLPSVDHCNPCLGHYDDVDDQYHFINQPFMLASNYIENDTIYLNPGESFELRYSLKGPNGSVLIDKFVSFSADEYISQHRFEINDDELIYSNNLELIWYGGLRPTEEKDNEDVEYGSGIIGQAGEIEDIQTKDPDEEISRSVYNGQTEWVAVRTKYFMSALIVENPGKYAVLSAGNVAFGGRKQTPVYHAGIGYPLDIKYISSKLYLGPLDVDHLIKTGTNLDATMNWGFTLIRPISKGILWVLKFMHNALRLNYGLVLLLFALIIRLITGPLTKKSYESSQNMQKLQPQIKKLQAKYKKDPQRLNRETMGLYKKHKVNPLGGCLPIMLQMPLLWALFIVFRTTIEFRGASFVFWISDLSQPDVIFNLPFSIPIYGSGVAVLPLLMGATLMLTMRMSSATMDKSQKPVMYFMNGFFILLFNTFPSGLNLYYTAYNVLSYFQQRSIKRKLAVP